MRIGLVFKIWVVLAATFLAQMSYCGDACTTIQEMEEPMTQNKIVTLRFSIIFKNENDCVFTRNHPKIRLITVAARHKNQTKSVLCHILVSTRTCSTSGGCRCNSSKLQQYSATAKWEDFPFAEWKITVEFHNGQRLHKVLAIAPTESRIKSTFQETSITPEFTPSTVKSLIVEDGGWFKNHSNVTTEVDLSTSLMLSTHSVTLRDNVTESQLNENSGSSKSIGHLISSNWPMTISVSSLTIVLLLTTSIIIAVLVKKNGRQQEVTSQALDNLQAQSENVQVNCQRELNMALRPLPPPNQHYPELCSSVEYTDAGARENTYEEIPDTLGRRRDLTNRPNDGGYPIGEKDDYLHPVFQPPKPLMCKMDSSNSESDDYLHATSSAVQSLMHQSHLTLDEDDNTLQPPPNVLKYHIDLTLGEDDNSLQLPTNLLKHHFDLTLFKDDDYLHPVSSESNPLMCHNRFPITDDYLDAFSCPSSSQQIPMENYYDSATRDDDEGTEHMYSGF